MHLVVFDIDGTLTRTDSIDEVCYVAAVEEVLSIRGIDTDWLSYPHVTDSGILRHVVRSNLGRKLLAGEMDRVCGCFRRRLEDAFRRQPDACLPVEGGPEMLSQLAGRSDLAVALATGGWESTARLKLERAGYDIQDIPLASASDADTREEIMRIASAGRGKSTACRDSRRSPMSATGCGTPGPRRASAGAFSAWARESRRPA